MLGKTILGMTVAAIVLLGSALSAQSPDILYFKFNEGTGTTTANDAPATPLTTPVTFAGTPTWNTTTQVLGAAAVSLPGGATNNLPTGGFDPSTLNASSWTFEAWVNTTSAATFNVILTSGGFDWLFYVRGTGAFAHQFNDGTGAATINSVTAVNDGNWHHVACVRDQAAGTYTLYIDGVQDIQVTDAQNITSTTSQMFNHPAVNIPYVDDLDELRLWSTARTGAQIAANMGSEIGNPFALPTAGSNFTGSSALDFAGSVDMGVALANFSIDCDDADSATIDATITTSGAAPGVTQPADVTAGTVAFPLVWTGTPTAIGSYTYTVTLDDGTTQIAFDVVLNVTDPAPSIQQPLPAPLPSPILITEFATSIGSDSIEIQNVSGAAFDATNWQLIVSNSYTNIDTANTTTQTLGNFATDQALFFDDNAAGAQYWGSNIFWDAAGSGWAMLIDDTGVVRDFVAWNWTTGDIAGMSVNAGGYTGLTPGNQWSGTGVTDNGNIFGRAGTQDNNDLTDWQDNGTTTSYGATNAGLTLPFTPLNPAVVAGADPAWTGQLLVGDDLGVTFTATDTSTTETLSFTITVTGGTLTAAQAGFNETFPFTPAGSVSPSSASLTGTAAMQGSIELTVQVSDGTNSDTITYTLDIVGPQEMDVSRGATPVADGGTDTVDIVSTGSNLTYTIDNTGGLDLNLTGTAPDYVVVAGVTNINTVTVTTQPTTPISGAGSVNFVINVVPNTASVGGDPYSFTVSIANDDSDENPYNFTVSGNAVTNVPPAVANQTGSNWVDAGGGLFTLTVNAGDSIADTLEATDATPDSMTVTITSAPTFAGLTAQPTDITTPTAGPISLTWTGTADGSNAVGNYDWNIDIDDGTSTTSIIARIILQNTAPTHSAVTGVTGDGLASGTQYVATGVVGSAAVIDIADCTDVNVPQNISVSGQTTVSVPGGSTLVFTFSTNASNPTILQATPSAAIAAADVGDHDYTADITDGTATVTVFVRITVITGVAPLITSAAAPSTATEGVLYSHTFTASGTPAATFSVTAGGPLPAWLTLSAGGLLSGTPAAGDVGTVGPFTVTASNGVAPDATEVVTITVSAAGGGGGGGGGGGDGGGCSTGTDGFNWLALLGLLGVVALGIRMRASKA